VLKNSFGIFLSRLIIIAVSLVSVPIVISYLGIAGYGVWESIIAVSVLCNIAQMTVSGTLLWKVSGAFGAHDYQAAFHYVRVGIFASLLLFSIFTPIAWFSRHFLVALFHVPQQFISSAEVILPLVVALMLLGSINEVIAALLSGFQRSGVANLIQSVSTACNYSVVIISLLTGFGFWSLLLGFATAFLVSLGALFGVARYFCGPVSLVPQVPSVALIRSVRGYSGFMLFHSLVAGFRDQSDRIILAAVASPIWTGYFGIAARLTSPIWMVCQFLYVPLIAASGALAAGGDWAGLRRLYAHSSLMLSVTVGFMSVTIAALPSQLITLWLRRSMPEAVPIIYLLLLGSVVAIVLSGVGTAMFKGIGMVRMEAYYLLAGVMINLLLKVVLIPTAGALGTVIASTTSMTLSSIGFVILMHKRVKQLPWSSSLTAAKTLGAVICTIIVARILFPSLGPEANRMDALLSLCLLVPLVAITYFLFLLILKVVSLTQLRLALDRFRAKGTTSLYQ
jgi:O-antigen/teichoic acid export membrane protein